MRTVFGSTVAGILFVASAFGTSCQLQYDPVSVPQYYRSQGWVMPGVKDWNPSAPAKMYGAPSIPTIPDATARLLPHREDPYVVEFPAQVFQLNKTPHRMRRVLAKATIVRWEINGKVVAYSYGLSPVSTAAKQDGRWTVDGEAGCMFDATFIDDKGDGIFRVLVPGPLTPDLVPAWAKKPTG
jgi:hypothetical protein